MDIKLINITKEYEVENTRHITAIKNINLDIVDGSYIAFFGPSGSGKSTLLNIITGILLPTKGHIYWGKYSDNNTNDTLLSKLRSKYFGIVFQNPDFIPEMTIKENIVLPLIINGILPSKKKEYFETIVEKLKIVNLINRFPHEVSGGEQKKVAIARALINNPSLLIADEPTANLDLESANEILNIFSNLNKLGLTIVLATHDKRFVKHAKEIYFLEEGKIVNYKSK